MASSNRVAFYVPSLTGGGAQQVTVNLANGLVKRDMAVDLVVSYRTGALLEQVVDAVSIVDLGTPRVPVVGVGASVPAFVRYLQRENPDVVFSQMHYANVVSVLSHRLAGREGSLVLTEHTIFGRPNHGKDELVFALAKRLYRYADHVIAVSSGVAESVHDCVGIPSEQLTVMNNPVVTDTLREDAEAAVDHPWLTSPDVTVVLGVGRLVPDKDFSTLLEAVARASRTDPSLRLVVLGKGPRREALQRLAVDLEVDDRLSLPGYVANPYAYMRRADVFALSSRREGLPTALIEAMACGCPVVSTDCRSGPREVLAGGAYGPLVPVGEADALAAGILDVLRDPPSTERLRERADDYSVEAVLDEYVGFIEDLA